MLSSPPAPDHTNAIVVGIERYEEGDQWNLDGPVRDALDFVAWLRTRGVPDENLHILLSPLDTNQHLLHNLTPVPLEATSFNVQNAFTRTLRTLDVDLLY